MTVKITAARENLVDEATALANPLDMTPPSHNVDVKKEAASHILKKIYASKQPFFCVDAGASRYEVADEANQLVHLTGFPACTTPFGKSIINKTLPNFHGMYATVGKNNISAWAKACDLILCIGSRVSNINTYGYTNGSI